MPKNATAVQPSTQAVKAARKYVAQRWPELAEVEPSIAKRQRRPTTQPATGAKSAPRTEYVLTFRTTVKAADGQALPRTARVTIDEQGRVIRATSSK